MNNLLKHKVLYDSALLIPIDFDEDDTIVNSRQYEDKPEWGIVLSVGSGRVLESGGVLDPGVEEGDVVVYQPYGVTPVRSHGTDFFFIRLEDILSKYTA